MSGILNQNNTLLLIVDIQERLLPAMDNPRNVIENNQKLLTAAKIFNIPVIVSEHYIKGLGGTATSLVSYLNVAEAAIFEKITFSCFKEKTISEAVKQSQRKQILVTGIESHVCVLQTALDFQAQGYDIFVCADAVSSRKKENVDLALRRLQQNNVSVVSVEMVLFEWLENAKHNKFKEIISLVK